MLQLIIQGRGGQGAQMAGEVLARAYFEAGKFVQAFSSYGGSRRGTPVSSFIRVDDRPIRERCDVDEPDAIVCFDATLLGPNLFAGAGPETVVLVNSSWEPERFADLGYPRLATIDAIAIAQANGLGRIVNSPVMGALARLLGEPEIDLLARVIYDVSPGMKEENANSARDGYRLVRQTREGGV